MNMMAVIVAQDTVIVIEMATDPQDTAAAAVAVVEAGVGGKGHLPTAEGLVAKLSLVDYIQKLQKMTSA
jgi:hypothetical protein